MIKITEGQLNVTGEMSGIYVNIEVTFEDMTPAELMQFHDTARAHPRVVACQLWPTLPAGAIAASRDLAHYAANLATVKTLQAEESQGAEKYLKICERIKQDLPDYTFTLLGE